MASLVAKTTAFAPIAQPQGRRSVVVCRAQDPKSDARPSLSMGRRVVLGAGLATALVGVPMREARAITTPLDIINRQGEIRRTEDEWKELLGPAYNVLRKEATELPYTSPLNNEKRVGTFECAGCGTPVYSSTTKYNSGTGWPSFYQALPGAVDEVLDMSIPFYPRTEIRCHKCQGHLGHVFDDGPRPTKLRYCMNGLALKFVPSDSA